MKTLDLYLAISLHISSPEDLSWALGWEMLLDHKVGCTRETIRGRDKEEPTPPGGRVAGVRNIMI